MNDENELLAKLSIDLKMVDFYPHLAVKKSTFCRKFQKFKKLEINLAISFFLRSNYD